MRSFRWLLEIVVVVQLSGSFGCVLAFWILANANLVGLVRDMPGRGPPLDHSPWLAAILAGSYALTAVPSVLLYQRALRRRTREVRAPDAEP